MTNELNLTTETRFSVHIDFSDLEKLGWEFGDLYQDRARAMEISEKKAEKQIKRDYHVRIHNRFGRLYYSFSHNEQGDEGSPMETGDDEKTVEDIKQLYAKGLVWELDIDEQ